MEKSVPGILMAGALSKTTSAALPSVVFTCFRTGGCKEFHGSLCQYSNSTLAELARWPFLGIPADNSWNTVSVGDSVVFSSGSCAVVGASQQEATTAQRIRVRIASS